MHDVKKRSNKIPIAIAIFGITLELVAIWLLASKRIPMATASPLILAGMFLAFVPIFVAARRARITRPPRAGRGDDAGSPAGRAEP